MARGENPGQIISLPSTLTYSATTDFGNAAAGKGRAVSINRTGNDAGKVKLAENNEPVIGILLDLDKDQVASVMITGTLIMLQDAVGGCTPGGKIVGAAAVNSGNGYVNNAPAAQANLARGQVLKVLENTAGGRVLVQFP